jgi:hypothetical protein
MCFCKLQAIPEYCVSSSICNGAKKHGHGPIMSKPDLVIASFLIMVQMDYVDHWPALEKNRSSSHTMYVQCFNGSLPRTQSFSAFCVNTNTFM